MDNMYNIDNMNIFNKKMEIPEMIKVVEENTRCAFYITREHLISSKYNVSFLNHNSHLVLSKSDFLELADQVVKKEKMRWAI